MKMSYLQKVKTALMSQESKRMLGICLFMAIGLGVAMAANANQGISALTTVTENIKLYIPEVQKLIYAIAGIVAVVGAVQVYFKMNNGDQDVSKSIMMLVGACLFLVAAAAALPKFFGV